jgi:hypothetical protein
VVAAPAARMRGMKSRVKDNIVLMVTLGSTLAVGVSLGTRVLDQSGSYFLAAIAGGFCGTVAGIAVALLLSGGSGKPPA